MLCKSHTSGGVLNLSLQISLPTLSCTPARSCVPVQPLGRVVFYIGLQGCRGWFSWRQPWILPRFIGRGLGGPVRARQALVISGCCKCGSSAVWLMAALQFKVQLPLPPLWEQVASTCSQSGDQIRDQLPPSVVPWAPFG